MRSQSRRRTAQADEIEVANSMLGQEESYDHLVRHERNPVRAGLVVAAHDYQWWSTA
jgi:hypothetical protein